MDEPVLIRTGTRRQGWQQLDIIGSSSRLCLVVLCLFLMLQAQLLTHHRSIHGKCYWQVLLRASNPSQGGKPLDAISTRSRDYDLTHLASDNGGRSCSGARSGGDGRDTIFEKIIAVPARSCFPYASPGETVNFADGSMWNSKIHHCHYMCTGQRDGSC